VDALAEWLCVRLSGGVDSIVAVSEGVREHLQARGMRMTRCAVIVNGTNTDVFRPMPAQRAEQRRELGIPEDAFVVGVTARITPIKAPERLIAALAHACPRLPGLHAVWIGDGAADYVDTVRRRADAAGLRGRLHLPGQRLHVERALNALDAFALLSRSEGLSRALIEAMAVGLPCIVDRRAGADVVAGAGVVVDADDAGAVASAIEALLDDDERRVRMGIDARNCAIEHYSLRSAIVATETLLQRCADARADGAR
jgi:glycosyltransferase involved in cell wall biosynthesis